MRRSHIFFFLILAFLTWDFIQYLSRMFAEKQLSWIIDHGFIIGHHSGEK